MEKNFNRRYAASTTAYFGLFAATFNFVSVYLLHKGFDNATIGLVLSISGLLSIFLQTSQASFLDKRPSFRLQNAISINILIVLIGSILLLLTQNNPFVLFLIVVIFAFVQASETLLNSMAFIFEKFGIQINYGLGRGMGSLSFAVLTMVIGNIVERTSPEWIPAFYLIIGSLLLIFIRRFTHPKEKEGYTKDGRIGVQLERETADQSLFAFFKTYKRLLFLMIGVVCLFFTHTLVNNFLIQIITPIGGNSVSLGIAIFISGIVELPAMFNYQRIENRIPAKNLLKISGFFFLIKHVLTFIAPNMTVIYIAQFFQIGAFALIYPTCVSYIRSIVSEKDAIKGQSLFTSSMAASGVVGSFLGGILLDEWGVPVTLLVGIAANIMGLIIIFFATESKEAIKDAYK